MYISVGVWGHCDGKVYGNEGVKLDLEMLSFESGHKPVLQNA